MASTVAFHVKQTEFLTRRHAAIQAAAPLSASASKHSSGYPSRAAPAQKRAPAVRWVPTTKARRASEQVWSDSSDSEKSVRTDDACTPSTDAGDDMSVRFCSVRSGDDTSSGVDSDFGEDACASATLPAGRVEDAARARIYPVAMLVQLRAAFCGFLSDESSVQQLGYGTRADAELVRLGLAPAAEASPAAGQSSPTSLASCRWRAQASSDQQAAGVDAPSWRQQPMELPPTSGNSWVAQVKMRRQSAKVSDDEQVARLARSILNKLTLERFDSLYEQLAQCGLRTPTHVAILMREVHEKATSQHHFIDMYVDLCVRLEQDARVASAVEAEQNGFRRLLLNECQSAFERLLEPQASPGGPEDEEMRVLRKQRALGNVKFVGQLIVRGMLSAKLLITCSQQLLASWQICDDALESLTALLPVACPAYDTTSWPHKPQLDTIFARASELVASSAVPARIRFLLRDVLDMRREGWPDQPRAAVAKAPAPMTLDQVRESQAAGERSLAPSAPAAPQPSATAASARVTQTPQPTLPILVLRSNVAKPTLPVSVLRSDAPKFMPAAAASPEAAVGRSVLRASAAVFTPVAEAALKTTAASALAPSSTPTTASPASSAPATPTPKHATPLAQLKPPKLATPPPKPFDAREFRRELSATMKALGVDRNVAAAVRRIRAQNVPKSQQAKEFVDILTRAVEENRGPVRRTAFAFAAGLAAATDSPFERDECIAGVGTFFQEVYDDLREEVPRLRVIASAELMPTLCSVLPEATLRALLPEEVANLVK